MYITSFTVHLISSSCRDDFFSFLSAFPFFPTVLLNSYLQYRFLARILCFKYQCVGSRRFRFIMAMSSSDIPTYRRTYSSAPPYFSWKYSKKASIVSALSIGTQKYFFKYRSDSYRHVNMLRAASLFDANNGSFDNLFNIISRAGSRPIRLRA